ncbi:MAG TPA: hypothetical protein VGO57_03635 [Verrucomicrobiae bacterium]|jgi:hypothetical protein
MNFYAGRFNLYLLAGLALALACGCASSEKKKEDKSLGRLRVHIESTANSANGGQVISVLRAKPVAISIANEPILTEASIIKAVLQESPGGFLIRIQFDTPGSWTLEQFSAANPNEHFAIFGQWTDNSADSRWLAAPLITGRIADGILMFTPDMSHEEAVKYVKALNRSAKKAQNGE